VGAYVFISYQHGDKSYVDKFAAFLSRQKIPVWYDLSMVPGDRYIQVLQEQIDACVAVIVVLTPEAAASEWVQREIGYATATNKPLLPVELRATKELLPLANLHRESVHGGAMPSANLLVRLRALLELDPPAPVTPTVAIPHVTNPASSDDPAVSDRARAESVSKRLESSVGWFPRCGPFDTGYPRGVVDAALSSLAEQARLGELQLKQVDEWSDALAAQRRRFLGQRGYLADAVDALFDEVRTTVVAWRRGRWMVS
jgi:hypothetical protein